MPFAHDTMNATGRHSVLCQPVPPAPPGDPANWFRTSVYGSIDAAAGAALQSAHADDYVVLVDSVVFPGQGTIVSSGEAQVTQRAEFRLAPGVTPPNFTVFPFVVLGNPSSERELILDLPGSYPSVAVASNEVGEFPIGVAISGGGSGRQTLDVVNCQHAAAVGVGSLSLTNISANVVYANGADGAPGEAGAPGAGAIGQAGDPGQHGLLGLYGPTNGGAGGNGGSALDGTAGTAGADGTPAVPTIVLENCEIQTFFAQNGSGGAGGAGGAGGDANGGAGGAGGSALYGDYTYPNGANGGNGGNGGYAGNGGNGGNGGNHATLSTTLVGAGATGTSLIVHYYKTTYSGLGGSGGTPGIAEGGPGGAGGQTWSDEYGPVGVNGSSGGPGAPGNVASSGASGSSPTSFSARTLVDPLSSITINHQY